MSGAEEEESGGGWERACTSSCTGSCGRSCSSEELSARFASLRDDEPLHALVRSFGGRVPLRALATHLSWSEQATRRAVRSLVATGQVALEATVDVHHDDDTTNNNNNNNNNKHINSVVNDECSCIVVVLTRRHRIVLRDVCASCSRADIEAMLRSSNVSRSVHSLERLPSLAPAPAAVDWIVGFASESDALDAVRRIDAAGILLAGKSVRVRLRSETPLWLLPPVQQVVHAAARAAQLASMQQFFYNNALLSSDANSLASSSRARRRAPRRSARKNASSALLFSPNPTAAPTATTTAAAAAAARPTMPLHPSIAAAPSSSSSPALSPSSPTRNNNANNAAAAVPSLPRHGKTPSLSEPSSSGRGSERSRSSSATSSNGADGLMLSDALSPPDSQRVAADAGGASVAPLLATSDVSRGGTFSTSPKRVNVTFVLDEPAEASPPPPAAVLGMRKSVPPPLSVSDGAPSGLVKSYSAGHAASSRPWHEVEDDDDDEGMLMLTREFLTSSLTLLKSEPSPPPAAAAAAAVVKKNSAAPTLPLSWAAMAALSK